MFNNYLEFNEMKLDGMNWYQIEVESCTFANNIGLYAGAIFSPSIYINSTENKYKSNKALWNNDNYI